MEIVCVFDVLSRATVETQDIFHLVHQILVHDQLCLQTYDHIGATPFL